MRGAICNPLEKIVVCSFLLEMHEQPVIDVYDAVSMSVVSPLSEQSIRLGSTAVKIPDFTRGKWKTNEPIFGLNDYI